MSQRLTDMTLTRVSLVDKGANARRLAVLKRNEEDEMDDVAAAIAKVDEARRPLLAGLIDKLAAFIGGTPAQVTKVQTFAAMVAGQELQEALGDSWWTLQDALWSAIYATDENGADLTLEAKQALVAQDLDEFKAYLLAEMSEATSVAKRASPAELAQRQVAAIVAKAGRKISGARLERLQTAAEALNSVLTEVADAKEEADPAEEEPVEKNELVAAITEAVTKAQEPLVARIEAIEKSAAAAAGDQDQPATLDTVVDAISKLADRVEAMESTKGVRKSADGQEAGGEVKKRSVFAGMF